MGRISNHYVAQTLLKPYHKNLQEIPYYQSSLVWSLKLLFIGLTLWIIDEPLGLPNIVQAFILTTSFSFLVVSITVIIMVFVNLTASHISRLQALAGNNVTLISLTAGVLRVFVIVAAILILADLLGIPYQGVLAVLGVGGLAVALAAQPTLQNFISGITLYFDKPIAIGDYCRFGSREGTVEFIGMRSTRIRTLDRTLVTVPNSEFSNMQIENYALRDRMFLNSTIKIRYETTPDQMRYLLAEIRALLIAHPMIATDPLRVRFSSFDDHSLNINIFSYVLTNNRAEFLAIQEDILLRLMSLVENAGVKFALPAVVHYNTQDSPPDSSKVKEAECMVEQWRAEHKLPFPDFSWQDKSTMSNSLDYPPWGSVDRKS